MNTLKRKNVWIPFRVDIIELCIILYYNFLIDRQWDPYCAKKYSIEELQLLKHLAVKIFPKIIHEGKGKDAIVGQLTVQTILLFTYGVTRIRANREIFNFHCSNNSSDCLKKGGKLRVSPIGGERYAEASIVTVYLPLVLTPLVVAFEALRLSVRVPFRQLDGPERSNDTRYAIVFRG